MGAPRRRRRRVRRVRRSRMAAQAADGDGCRPVAGRPRDLLRTVPAANAVSGWTSSRGGSRSGRSGDRFRRRPRAGRSWSRSSFGTGRSGSWSRGERKPSSTTADRSRSRAARRNRATRIFRRPRSGRPGGARVRADDVRLLGPFRRSSTVTDFYVAPFVAAIPQPYLFRRRRPRSPRSSRSPVGALSIRRILETQFAAGPRRARALLPARGSRHLGRDREDPGGAAGGPGVSRGGQSPEFG